MGWPFKHIKQQSSWPMQGLVITLAGEVLKAPSSKRQAAAMKIIERCVRMGARIAVEFGMPGDVFVALAKQQMIREGGVVAKAAIAHAAADAALELHEKAAIQGEAMKAQLDAIFKGKALLPDMLDDPLPDPDKPS